MRLPFRLHRYLSTLRSNDDRHLVVEVVHVDEVLFESITFSCIKVSRGSKWSNFCKVRFSREEKEPRDESRRDVVKLKKLLHSSLNASCKQDKVGVSHFDSFFA